MFFRAFYLQLAPNLLKRYQQKLNIYSNLLVFAVSYSMMSNDLMVFHGFCWSLMIFAHASRFAEVFQQNLPSKQPPKAAN